MSIITIHYLIGFLFITQEGLGRVVMTPGHKTRDLGLIRQMHSFIIFGLVIKHISLLVTFSADCSAGYYCTGGSWIPDPIDNSTGNICPMHHICVAGNDVPQLCQIGYYANNTGLSTCTLCIAGYLCYPGDAPVLCPQGLVELARSDSRILITH